MHRFLLAFVPIILMACHHRSVQSADDFILSEEDIKAVRIDEGGFIGPCEPSIVINPKDPDNIIAGAVLDRVYVSMDGGQSWQKERLTSSHGVYGDPVVRASNDGSIYYAHLSNPNGKAFRDTAFLDRIVIQKSEDKGKTWNDGSFTLPRSPKDQDKQWLAIDPADNSVYISWTEFDLYGSASPDHKSRILFSRSIDGGSSWSYPVVLSDKEGDCLDDDQTTEGAVPSVGPEGQIYVAWSYDGNIYLDKSYDKGETWLNEDLVVAEQPGGWTYDIPGLMRCNGMPVTAVDRSSGKFNGRVYVNWSDQRHGVNDTDVWLSYSDDEGETWSDPFRVNNDDTAKHQFLSWMAVDQGSGFIYIVFYDRRHHNDNGTDVYLAVSSDGGASFRNIKINKNSFVPLPMVFFGDYNDISVLDGRVRPVWTEFREGRLSVWTALIN